MSNLGIPASSSEFPFYWITANSHSSRDTLFDRFPMSCFIRVFDLRDPHSSQKSQKGIAKGSWMDTKSHLDGCCSTYHSILEWLYKIKLLRFRTSSGSGSTLCLHCLLDIHVFLVFCNLWQLACRFFSICICFSWRSVKSRPHSQKVPKESRALPINSEGIQTVAKCNRQFSQSCKNSTQASSNWTKYNVTSHDLRAAQQNTTIIEYQERAESYVLSDELKALNKIIHWLHGTRSCATGRTLE